jgi:hypothetical protein
MGFWSNYVVVTKMSNDRGCIVYLYVFCLCEVQAPLSYLSISAFVYGHPFYFHLFFISIYGSEVTCASFIMR